MEKKVANLPMNETDEIMESAHSENTQTTELTPEEKMDQIVEEITSQHIVINPPVEIQENEEEAPDKPLDQTEPEPSFVEEEFGESEEKGDAADCDVSEGSETVEDVEETEEIEISEEAVESEEVKDTEENIEIEDDEDITIASEPLIKELPTTPDNFCGDLQEAIEVGAISMINKQDIIDELKQLVDNSDHSSHDQIEKLKQSYYRLTKAENDELKKIFIEKGGDETEFRVPEDEFAPQFRDLLAQLKQQKMSLIEKEESTKEENYAKKLQLIDRLQALIESHDDFNKQYNEFKEIQQKWKEYNPVPYERSRELWRNYQIQNERFYTLIKINNQFRDYDYKKNLELKTGLCETVEKLAEESDAVSAYHQSQKLYMQWREIGPVAREFREELWARFKAASAVINKKHHAHFEILKEKEEENLKEKTKLCEIAEAIDCELLKTFNDWEKKTQEIVELQNKWRTIGFATKKHSNKIFDRFRSACDAYFKKKSAFYKAMKKEFEKNYQLKKGLIEKVESLKQHADLKEATKEIVKIQSEWKKIGPVSRKYTDALWKEFITGCDYFFKEKNKISDSQRSAEQANLATKQLLIEKIQTLDTNLSETESLTALRLLIAEWNTVGHVPFKEKDKLYKNFRETVDKQYDFLNVAQVDRRIQQYRTSLTEISSGGQNKGKLHNEREKLMRMYEKSKQELQTFENNMGFFNVSSKGGGSLLKEMENRIERLKNEMELIVKKIDAIDENLE